ncbi:GlsB/YeaQ/YmgE family stress response membrane protein [Rikenella microfusus]|uniref:Transglycosylase associated protein n=1 Tax=Rikenella microfusus TaxID=28139 RepID=A0A379MSM1_9BACT|nr:GlsB/YeaQ/YmgE family stress response membrane protein [Rikenella microfusus]SUE34661.1 Transglycosylase associated protein [Rikenella microfusus]HJE89103.1 GlsB/YeaQ/YmgE family stress response membrane protein [Rikenella microfusus]
MYFVWFILIGLVVGWLASLIVKGSGSGFIVNIIIGILGGVLGGWLFSLFGLIPVGTFGSLLTALVGAIILLWLAALVRKKN